MDMYLDVNDAVAHSRPALCMGRVGLSFVVELKAGTAPLDAFIDRFVAELAGRQN